MLKLDYRIDEKVVVIKKNVMYYRSIYYAVLLVVFGTLGYVFLNSGFNTETKIKVEYEDKSEIYYKVNYVDDVYEVIGDRYVANMIDDINIYFDYENIISENVGGFYRYGVDVQLVAFEKDSDESLWKRDYKLVNDKTVVLDANNINNISITGDFVVKFNEYRNELYSFMDEHDMDLSGYLQVKINIFESLKFASLDNQYDDNKVITVDIPLTDDTFKINVKNLDSKNDFYEFTNDKAMNIVLLIVGAFCGSVSVALLVLVIKQFKIIYAMENEYNRKLDKILSKYDNCIVKVKRLIVSKKYNMIYVDSFEELLDVYYKKNKMISFKETKRDNESIFVIIDEEDAWIYRLES